MQKFQDWFTQKWVVISGRKINSNDFAWLLGPMGDGNVIGEEFIYRLAKKENLSIERNLKNKGLLSSFDKLHFTESELSKLSLSIVEFYEHTSNFHLKFKAKWSPLFRVFGFLVNRIFSVRINQLNIPTSNASESEDITNEIIDLIDPKTKEGKYKFWLRKFSSSGKVIYLGIYDTCTLPSGKTCIKAVFPLPNGNATVIMEPSIGDNNELILDSSGNTYGDAGFYFLLKDKGGNFWARYISSFTDKLVVYDMDKGLQGEQTLQLWNKKVTVFNYTISQ